MSVMSDFLVFDKQFNLIGVIDAYQKAEITRNYGAVSELILDVVPSTDNKHLLKTGYILVEDNPPERRTGGVPHGDGVNYGYEITHYSYVDSKEESVQLMAQSLNSWLYNRVIPVQQRYVGEVASVIYSFIHRNMIMEVNRAVPDLVLSTNVPTIGSIESMTTGGQLGEHVFELCEQHECTIEIYMDHSNKKFIAEVLLGKDRTFNQSLYPQVIFDKEFDNLGDQEYIYNVTNSKTTVYIAGDGEGVNRTIVVSGNNVSGHDRKELYVDARDLQKTYRDDNDVEVTLTDTQYNNQLIARGNEYLSDYKIIETYNATTFNVQYIYGIDYFLGDKVSIGNDTINKQINTRVKQVVRTLEKQAEVLVVNFGEALPTMLKF